MSTSGPLIGGGVPIRDPVRVTGSLESVQLQAWRLTVCLYVHIRVYIYIYIYIHIYIYIYIYTHILYHIYIYMFIYIYMHTYIYTYVHISICTRISLFYVRNFGVWGLLVLGVRVDGFKVR